MGTSRHDNSKPHLDERFVACYGHACDAIGNEAPVIIVLGDALVVYHAGHRRQIEFGTASFHTLKTIAHAPVALFALLYSTNGAQLDDVLRKRLLGLREHVAALSAGCDAPHRSVLVATAALIDETSRGGCVDAGKLQHFARALSPALQTIVEHATQLQLAALHACVERVLSTFTSTSRAQLQVVITGDHQARVRSLGMQYFQKRFGEPSGADDRVTYAEGVSHPDEAFALVAKRRLDGVLALAFFGDRRRLQRDVLGDAARDALADLDLARIE